VLVGCVEPNERSLTSGGKPLFNSSAVKAWRSAENFFQALLPNYDVFDEHRYFEPGLASNSLLSITSVSVSRFAKTGGTMRNFGKRSYAINPIADLAELGVDLMVNLSASPYSVGKQHLREAMLRHSAIRYRQPLLYVNQVGANDDLIFDGSSVGFNRAGEIVCRARAF